MKPYTLLIKPVGGDCNIRCEYCFYLRTLDTVYPEQKRHRMDEETLRRIISGFMGEGFPVSGLCFQGGEPTLAGLDFYKQVVDFEKRYGKDGQSVSNSIQTNGTLLNDEWAKFLKEYNFLIGVSIDGPPHLHDHYRVDAGGKGTHDKALRGMRVLEDNGVEFNILAVVNKRTAKHAREVYDYFRELGITHLQFIPIVEMDSRTGQIADFIMTPEEYGTFLCELWDEWVRPGFPEISIRDFEAWIERLLGGSPSICTYASSCNQYIMLEHNGDAYPCDFFCDPKYKLGNVNEESLTEIFTKAKHDGFARLKTVYPKECYSCQWLSLCHGGCTKDRMNGSSMNPEVKARGSNYFCKSYKMFFAHAYEQMQELKDRIWAMETGAAAAPGPAHGHQSPAGRNAPCPCGSGRKFKHCCMPRGTRAGGG
jgi:uncharacterized protein